MVFAHPFQKLFRFLAIVLTVLMTCMCAPARPQNSSDTVIDVDGLKRTYLLYTPSSYDSSRATPLVLALHGRGGDGQGMLDLTGFNQVAEREGFIIAYLNGYENSWADGRGTTPADGAAINDVLFVQSLIDKLSSDYNILQEQIYVTGFSNGGYLSYRLACELSDRVVAVAPVGANLSENIAATCAPNRAVPVLQISGRADPLTPYDGGDAQGAQVLSAEKSVAYWAEKNGCGEASNTNLPNTTQDGTLVTLSSYAECQEGADVQLYTIIGGGHTWPGGLQYLPERTIGKTSQDINASEVIWKFFAEHPLR
jgi:polyhydroxybutyrate depolymerase